MSHQLQSTMQILEYALLEAAPTSIHRETGALEAPLVEALPDLFAADAWMPNGTWQFQMTGMAQTALDRHPMLLPPLTWHGDVPVRDAYTMRLRHCKRACFFSPPLLPARPNWAD